jgi:hypothetical protein
VIFSIDGKTGISSSLVVEDLDVFEERLY